jgi:two-component system cell cycle sensor histidine kinase/response regulator CckA
MALILIVEDEPQVRVLMESFLQEQGHKTLSAGTEKEALALLADSRVDIMFTDVILHDDIHAGLTLAQEAVEQHPGLRVLYTTGQDVTDGIKALFVENSAFLPKPYTAEQVQTVLQVSFGAGFGSEAPAREAAK